MKVALRTIALALTLTATAITAEDGASIMKKNDALPDARTTKIDATLIILKGGQKQEKTFQVFARRYPTEMRTRFKFLKPTRIEMLSWNLYGKDDLQWVRLSSGSVRMIASSDRGSAFANSHFYYEDINSRDVDQFHYKLLGDVNWGGHDCYKVESVKAIGAKVYDKSIVYVRKSDFFVVGEEFFEDGRHTKTLKFEEIGILKGYITPRRIVMERADGSGKSIYQIDKIEYDTALPDTMFNKENL
ncbi:MAG: outer membrane lipoprotein-sorting protein [Spirochaetia bacterium]|nr:outer membrane lipoprotein-sorting protein [Spirochaetia bacterium]